MKREDRPSDYDRQADHAVLFGAVSRRMMKAAAEFAQDISPALTVVDAARIYLGAGAYLALSAHSAADVAGMLRQLADELERGAPVAN